MMKTGAAAAMIGMATLLGYVSAQTGECASVGSWCADREGNTRCCVEGSSCVETGSRDKSHSECVLDDKEEPVVGEDVEDVADNLNVVDLDAEDADLDEDADDDEDDEDDGYDEYVEDADMAEDESEVAAAPVAAAVKDVDLDLHEDHDHEVDAVTVIAAGDPGDGVLTDTDGVLTGPDDLVVATDVLTGADSVTYVAFVEKDYIPKADKSTLVAVEDIDGAAMIVEKPQDCEDFCTETPGCNAASYYLNPVGGNNCWLKTIDHNCEMPADVLTDPNAVLLLQFDDTCEAALLAAAGPAGVLADGPMGAAEGPIGIGGIIGGDALEAALAPATAITDRDLDDTPIESPSSSSAAVSVASGLAALAVAAGIAFF